MKKILAALLLAVSSLAGAQTYPSPTFQNITILGTSTLSGITLTSLAAQAANTVVANVTGSSAIPTAVAIPSCSTTSSALEYSSGVGFGCNTAINATQLGGTNSTAYALLASPAFTGVPSAPTPTTTTNSTQIATAAMVNAAVTGDALAGSFTSVTSAGAVSGTAASFSTLAVSGTGSGLIGYIVSGTGSSVALTTGTAAACTSISVPAGDWDIQGSVGFSPASTTTVTQVAAAINTSVALASQPGSFVLTAALTTGAAQGAAVPPVRVTLASATTYYLVAQASFATSTMAVNCSISARKMP